MRVLHVLEAVLGGTRRYLQDIIAASPHTTFESALVYSERRPDGAFATALTEARAAGWTTFALDMAREISPSTDLRASLKLRRIVKEYRPDVIHCHSSKAGGIGRIAAASLRSRPRVVYSPHAIAALLGRHYLVIERLLSHATDRFVAVSASEREELIALGVTRPDRISVVYPVVDVERFIPTAADGARRELGLRQAPTIIGIGRATYQKNPEAFVRIIERAASSIPDLQAIWLGEGELLENMRTLAAARLPKNCLVLPGWSANVQGYLAAADVLLSTARYESFGYVVAEAMAMGRPVVASRVTGTTDVAGEGFADLLFAPSDEDQAARLLIQFLRDSSRARQVGLAGRDHIRTAFSPERMAAALANAYL